MCYNACPHFERFAELCRLPKGMPCPQAYESENDYQEALAEAEALREESAAFTHDANQWSLR